MNNNVELEAQLSQSNQRNKVTNYYCVLVSCVGERECDDDCLHEFSCACESYDDSNSLDSFNTFSVS